MLVHKLTWNGNDGEFLYAGAGADVDQVREWLIECGFKVGTPYVPRGLEGVSLYALPVVKTGCSLSELGDALGRGPEVAALESDGLPLRCFVWAGGRSGGDSHPNPAGPLQEP
jgi:hypothetical protein